MGTYPVYQMSVGGGGDVCFYILVGKKCLAVLTLWRQLAGPHED